MPPRESPKNPPQRFSKELAARTLLLIEQAPVILGARLQKTSFTQYLRLESTKKLFAERGDTGHVLRQIIDDPSMDREVTVQERRHFIAKHYTDHPLGIAYWQGVGKILWLQYAAYLAARRLADDTIERVTRRAKNDARRKLQERKRLMERHKREAEHKRWGQRA
jgi:hypothetical protein